MKYLLSSTCCFGFLGVLALLTSNLAFGIEYRHEFRISSDYNSSTGEVDSGGATTKIDQNMIETELSYGYIANDNVEPFFDLKYASSSDKVGSFETTSTITDWGVGMIFNIPSVDPNTLSKIQKKGMAASKTPKMSYAKWIPYGGVMLASMSSTGSGGAESTSDVSHDAIVTKLIFGTRYMLYPHIGLNFSMRAFYQDTQSEAKATTNESGGTKKLTIQTNLMSLTLFF